MAGNPLQERLGLDTSLEETLGINAFDEGERSA